MPISKPSLRYTPPPVGSLPELLAMAQAMEQEAARRYRHLAEAMRVRGDARLARLFDFLAGIEAKHATHVEARAQTLVGRPVDPVTAHWEVPETFDAEEGGSHLLTSYRALAVAVRNEERAFAFYSYVASVATVPQIREFAEELAKDELAHAWLLRRERRKAFRREGGAGRWQMEALPGSVAELHALAAAAERTAAAYHSRLAEALRLRDGQSAEVFARIASEEMEVADRIGDSNDTSPVTDGEPTIGGGLRLLEGAFERYVDIADRSEDEAVMQEAQRLAAGAVRRLAMARGGISASVAAA